VGLLTVLPLVAVAGGFAARLLPQHDVNYYLKLHPPEFIAAAVVIGVVALITAAVMLWLVCAGVGGAGGALPEKAGAARPLRKVRLSPAGCAGS